MCKATVLLGTSPCIIIMVVVVMAVVVVSIPPSHSQVLPRFGWPVRFSQEPLALIGKLKPPFDSQT